MGSKSFCRAVAAALGATSVKCGAFSFARVQGNHALPSTGGILSTLPHREGGQIIRSAVPMTSALLIGPWHVLSSKLRYPPPPK
jgi:hypothetical protein